MAWTLNGSTEFLRIASALSLAEPFTFAAWNNPTSRTVTQTILSASDGTSDAHYMIFREAGDALGAASNDQGISSGEGVVATPYAAGWNHAVATYASSTSRIANLNGGTIGGESTVNVTPDALSDINFGRYSASVGSYFGGTLQGMAVWAAALTNEECVSLYRGFSPRRIRPQSLLCYLPLVRAAFDWKGNALATATGSAAVHHRAYGF